MNIKYIIAYTSLILFASCSLAIAQCKPDECISKMGAGYTFLKHYSMEKLGNEVEHSYVLSKETNYMLVLCDKDGGAKNVEVSLFDASRKLVATNFDKKNNKYYSAIAYNCKATGIYYLRFNLTPQSECCVSVLAFKR